MRKVVSVFLPTWPTDRLRRTLGDTAPPSDSPLTIVGQVGNRRVVTAANLAAQALGIRSGLAATQAHALVPDLLTHDADRDADDAGLGKIALWILQRYVPIVAADPPDGLMLDATGASHLHGGDKALVDDLAARLAESGTAARIAMAGTYGAAHALARFGRDTVAVVAEGAEADAIGMLPLAALRLDGDTVASLNRLGFETIAELEATPRAPLALRFGSDIGRRLDQAFGRISEPIEPAEAPEIIRVTQRFAEPIAAPETLTRYTDKLVAQLCGKLERAGLGARRLELRFHRVDNRIEQIRAGTARPTRDHRRLVKLMCDRLDTIDPGFGVETMTLTAQSAEPLGLQAMSSLGEAARPDVAALVDILGNRVGEERLFRVAARPSDVPERSVVRVAPMADATTLRWPVHWPRPPRLLVRPEPIETMALLPDNPPVHFTWRGTRRRVKRADGPERIYGEWVTCDAEMLGVRDYFMVEDEAGARYWIYRNGDGEDVATGTQAWFLHGLFA